jgi:hypothetical protein
MVEPCGDRDESSFSPILKFPLPPLRIQVASDPSIPFYQPEGGVFISRSTKKKIVDLMSPLVSISSLQCNQGYCQ